MLILNPISAQISVEVLLQLERKLSHVLVVIGEHAQVRGQLCPGLLLAAKLIVASALNDALVELQKVHIDVAARHGQSGLRFESGTALVVESSDILDELFVLGSALDGVDFIGVSARTLRGHAGWCMG